MDFSKKIQQLSLILLLLSSLSGCSLLGIDHEENKDAGPQSTIFESPFDKVWRAAQLALARYPIRVNNMDSGTLETDFIKREKIWRPPYQKIDNPMGQRHMITIRMVKGAYEDKNEAIKVVVSKTIEIIPDFITNAKKIPSDGIEEKAILYRIARELSIEKALVKANEKEQSRK